MKDQTLTDELAGFDAGFSPRPTRGTSETVSPPGGGRQPTPQQEDIYRAIALDSAHLVVSARAGAGKTTTAVGCLGQKIPGRLGFVAFNKHIATDLQKRLPPTVTACTMHSLGFAAVRRAYRDTKLDEQKLKKLADRLMPKPVPVQVDPPPGRIEEPADQPGPKTISREDTFAAMELARLCKYTLADEQDNKQLDKIVERYGVDAEDRAAVYQLARDLVGASAEETRTVDFDDMIWLPVRRNLGVDRFDLLLVDEAQDLNRCQQDLARKAAADGRLCPIGDQFQSIYGFTGADTDSIPRLSGELAASSRSCMTLPLTWTFRCPASHVALARCIVPSIQAAPWAIAGTVTADVDERVVGQTCKPGDLIICRRNAPVVSLAYRLILSGVRATVRGREIGRGLMNLVRRLKPNDISDLIARLERYRDREEKRLLQRDASAAAFQALDDRCDCLGQVAAQCDTLSDLERFLDRVFSDRSDESGVVLSSIHRAKGLEADRVFILEPEYLPMIRRKSQPWEVQQERNIAYVAVTRSKRDLVFVGPLPPIFGGQYHVG